MNKLSEVDKRPKNNGLIVVFPDISLDINFPSDAEAHLQLKVSVVSCFKLARIAATTCRMRIFKPQLGNINSKILKQVRDEVLGS